MGETLQSSAERAEQAELRPLRISGTVQEERCWSRMSTVTLYDTTERLETTKAGSNTLSAAAPDRVPGACARRASRAASREPTARIPRSERQPDSREDRAQLSARPSADSAHRHSVRQHIG